MPYVLIAVVDVISLLAPARLARTSLITAIVPSRFRHQAGACVPWAVVAAHRVFFQRYALRWISVSEQLPVQLAGEIRLVAIWGHS